jgi:predicted AlkP superfamily pyrophosphatase or phosphodiesterase
MRIKHCPLLFLLFTGSGLAQVPPKQRTVVVISLDGLPAAALTDPKLPVPTLRKLAQEGASARIMTTVNPTVTWPNHTAMVTGVNASQHGLLVNGTIMPTGTWPPVKIEPWLPKQQMVHVPTVYDLAFGAGLSTAQVDWVAIKSAPTITWEFPEVPSAGGPVEREMISRKIIDSADADQFTKPGIVWRDQMWTAAAVHIIREHKPNLLLFHLLSLDSTHHSYGPGSLAATNALAFLDSRVAELLTAIRAAGLEERTTVLVVSDHGFKRVTKQIHASAAVSQSHLDSSVFVLPEGGYALVYVDKRGSAGIDAARKLFSGAEGIARVAGPEDYPSLGLPAIERDAQMSDLVLYASPGYAFSGGNTGATITTGSTVTGSHGYPNTDHDMDAIFIAWGYGIKAGVRLDEVRNVDVAPTVAELLGVKMPDDIEGKAIRAILK